jgi:hypothetical protein
MLGDKCRGNNKSVWDAAVVFAKFMEKNLTRDYVYKLQKANNVGSGHKLQFFFFATPCRYSDLADSSRLSSSFSYSNIPFAVAEVAEEVNVRPPKEALDELQEDVMQDAPRNEQLEQLFIFKGRYLSLCASGSLSVPCPSAEYMVVIAMLSQPYIPQMDMEH